MAKNTSFLPEDYLDKRAARRTNVVCLVLFILVMGGVVGAFFVTGMKRTEVRALQAQVNRQFEEAAARLEQLEDLQARKEEMLRKAKVTSVLVERVPRTLLLAELINHMPATLSLLEFELETKVVRSGPQPRTSLEREKARLAKQAEPEVQVPETEVTLSLIGVAPTDVEVAQFMTSLSKHELFNDVGLQFSEQTTINDQPMRKFRLALQLRQEVDVQEIEPTKIARQLKQNPMDDQIRIDGSGQFVPTGQAAVPVSDRRN